MSNDLKFVFAHSLSSVTSKHSSYNQNWNCKIHGVLLCHGYHSLGKPGWRFTCVNSSLPSVAFGKLEVLVDTSAHVLQYHRYVINSWGYFSTRSQRSKICPCDWRLDTPLLILEILEEKEKKRKTFRRTTGSERTAKEAPLICALRKTKLWVRESFP